MLGLGEPDSIERQVTKLSSPRKTHTRRSRQPWDESELKKNIQTQTNTHKKVIDGRSMTEDGIAVTAAAAAAVVVE